MARPLRSIQARARIARGWSLGFYIAGVAALGAGLLVGGIVAAATGTAAGFAVAAIIGGAGAGMGGLGLWESRRFRRRAERLEQTVSEQKLYQLAEQHGGVLRVADVARGLGVMRDEAEELLDHLVDEVQVSMRVTDDGEIHYVFRELERRKGPHVRVVVDEADAAEEPAVVPAESEQQSRD
jgi:hypothetical protein